MFLGPAAFGGARSVRPVASAATSYARAQVVALGARPSKATWLAPTASGCPAAPSPTVGPAVGSDGPSPPPVPLAGALGPISVLDDNVDVSAYLGYRARLSRTYPLLAGPDPAGRVVIRALDAGKRPVLDARVMLDTVAGSDPAAVDVRTGPDGRAPLLPKLVQPAAPTRAPLIVRKAKAAATLTAPVSGEKAVTLRVARATASPTKLDIAFVLDATASSSGSLRSVLKELALGIRVVGALGTAPDVRFAVTTFRDCGDEFVTHLHDFTSDSTRIAAAVESMVSDGGGDRPEQLALALQETLGRLAWRGDDTVRMAFVVTDAPPQVGAGDASDGGLWRAAVGASMAGIRLHTVLLPAVGDDAEFVLRQLSELTSGRALVIAAPGEAPAGTPGTSLGTSPLSQGVIRLVSEDLAWQGPLGRPLPPLAP